LSFSATATATPSVGTSAVTLSQTTVDGIDYTTREITIAPGGSTGWHFHDPTVYGVIRSGTLTRTVADCQVDGTFPEGAPLAEGQGPGHVHVGRNLGAEPVVMWVSYIAPAGTPLSVDVPDPGCGFA
jgi:quercetin dioxygenase-like cupin family protein